MGVLFKGNTLQLIIAATATVCGGCCGVVCGVAIVLLGSNENMDK